MKGKKVDKLLRRYWLPIVLSVLAIAQIIGAIGSVTFWKASDTISVELPGNARSQLVSTKDGVLSLYSTTAKLEIAGKGQVAIVIGRAADVAGWVTSTKHIQVSGLDNDQVFRTEEVAAKSTDNSKKSTEQVRSPLEDNARDMWVKVVTGKDGKATLEWDRPGNWAMLAWSEKGDVSLKITWPQEKGFNPFWLLLVGGLVALVLAVVSALTLYRIALAIEREKQEVAQAKANARELQKLAEAAPLTGQIPTVTPGAKLPSRAEMRKARERGEATVTYDGVEYATGIIPQIKIDDEGNAVKPQEAPDLAAKTNEAEKAKEPSCKETALSLSSSTPAEENHDNLVIDSSELSENSTDSLPGADSADAPHPIDTSYEEADTIETPHNEEGEANVLTETESASSQVAIDNSANDESDSAVISQSFEHDTEVEVATEVNVEASKEDPKPEENQGAEVTSTPEESESPHDNTAENDNNTGEIDTVEHTPTEISSPVEFSESTKNNLVKNNLAGLFSQKNNWENPEKTELPDKLTEVIWAEEPKTQKVHKKPNLFQRWFQQGQKDAEKEL